MILFNSSKTNKNAFGSTKAIQSPTSSKILLAKAEDGLNNIILRLKEEKNIDLSRHCARVFVIMDRSGSMENLYLNGSVQMALTRLLPLALKFGNNRELEVYLSNEN